MRLLKPSGRSTIVSRLRMTLLFEMYDTTGQLDQEHAHLITFLGSEPLFHDRSSCFEEISFGVGAFYASHDVR